MIRMSLSKATIRRVTSVAFSMAAALGSGCFWTDAYEGGQQPMETRQLFKEPGQAVYQLLLDDLNQDGTPDLVALMGAPRSGYSYLGPPAAASRVKAWTGDGKGGFAPLLDMDAQDVQPTHLGVWHPQGALPQIALYGTRVATGEGVVSLVSVGPAQVEQTAEVGLGSTGSGASFQATGGSGGGEQLVVGGAFRPTTGQDGTVNGGGSTTGTTTTTNGSGANAGVGEIKVLEHPAADHFTTLGPLELPGDSISGMAPLAVADFNADGRLDVVAADVGLGSVVMHLQRQDGTFARQDPVAWGIVDIPVQVITGDFNGDGSPDVRVLFESCHDAFYANDGEGRLGTPSMFHTVMDPTLHGVVADLDGDGHKDLLLTGVNGAMEVLLLNGKGTVAQQSARRVVVRADNTDGVDANAPLAVRLAQNVASKVGTRLAAAATLPLQGEVVAAGADVNHDGKPDLVFGTSDGQVLLYQGE